MAHIRTVVGRLPRPLGTLGGFYTGQDILRSLATRFDTRLLAEGTFLFPDLDGVSAADEQAAIDSGRIQATCIRYVGRPKRAD